MSSIEAARNGLDAAVAVFASGWNAGDANALALAFHDDATFVNRFGRLVRGRAAIADLHAPLFRSVYRGSEMACRVEDVDLLATDVARGHVRFDLKAPAPVGDLPGRMLVVLTRRDNEWGIAAIANVAFDMKLRSV